MGLSSFVSYDLRMAELKEIFEAGCISIADYDAQSHEYWLILRASSWEV